MKFKDRAAILREFEKDFTAKVTRQGDTRTVEVSRLTRYQLPQTKRTLPVHHAGENPYTIADNLKYESSYNIAHVTPEKPLKTANMKVKALIGHQNFGRTTQYADDIGDVLPKHSESKDARYFQTTSDTFYNALPSDTKAKWAVNPPPEKGDDERFIGSYPAKLNPNAPELGPFYGNSRHFFRDSKWEKDSFDPTKREDLPRGKCGARGELTRHPGESGSLAVGSVWADEYSAAT